MSPQDERRLEWFFSRGQTEFERSMFGGVLERQALYSIAQQYRPEMRPVYDAAGHIIGHERGITARPTAELHLASGYTPDIDTLTEYASLSRLLKRVQQRSRTSAVVLECLYGDLGQRWGRDDRYGQQGALFHLTARGQSMLTAAKAVKGALELGDVQRMEVLCAVQRVQPTAERRAQLEVCVQQAAALASAARRLWGEVKAGMRE